MTKRIVLIDESFPINSRNTRILVSIREAFPDCELHVISWDREQSFTQSVEPWTYHLFSKRAQYGNKIQKLLGMIGYKRYCKQIIEKILPSCIIASHWNNLLMLPSLDWHQTHLIYENLDAPTGPWLGRKLIGFIEHFYMRRAILTVHASRFYTQLYSPSFPQLILENKLMQTPQPVDYVVHQPMRIAFLGNIRYLTILQNLVDAVRDDQRFELTFHGGGPDLEKLKRYIGSATNVVCTGAYDYANMAALYEKTDLIWAAYPNKDFNVQYAISNKFHESIAYTIPAVYSEKTKLADYVTSHSIGLSVNPYSAQAIYDLLVKLASCPDKLLNCHQQLLLARKNDHTWQQEIQPLLDIL